MTKSIKRFVLIFSGLIALFSAWQIIDCTNHSVLWGYWPVVLFSFSWIFIRVLLSIKWPKESKKWRWLGWSTLSGVLLAFSFPPFPTTFLLFIAFVPLLIIAYEVKDHLKGRKIFWGAVYNAFVIWNILATYWVANTAFVAGIVAIWLNAFFMTIPFVLYFQARKYIPRIEFFSLIVFWLSFELLHLNWEITWPWLTLGNAFAEYPSLVQWYEYTGVFGGSLWVLLMNVLVFKMIKKAKIDLDKNKTTDWVQLVFLLIVPIFISIYIYNTYQIKGNTAEVVVVQPNFEPHYEKFNYPESDQMERFVQLSAAEVTDSTDFLVFPETSFGLVEISKIRSYPAIKTLKKFLSEYPNCKLITGLNSYKRFKKDEPSTAATRTQVRRKGDTIRWELYNGAIQFEASSHVEVQHYKKSKLVPGAEFLPYRKAFFFLKPLVESLQGSMSGHGKQTERSVFTNDVARIAPVICYESIYGDYCNDYIRKGAEALFIMTNDGWWDNTAGHKQHLKYASLRAIENRRDIARSANTGVSAFINQKGDILQPTTYGEAAAIKGHIRLNTEITFYNNFGDFIGRLAAFTSLILLLNLLVKKLMVNKRDTTSET